MFLNPIKTGTRALLVSALVAGMVLAGAAPAHEASASTSASTAAARASPTARFRRQEVQTRLPERP